MAIACSEQGYKCFEIIRNAVMPLGFFMLVPGIVLTVIMYTEDETQIYGPILLGTGCTLLFIGFVFCIVSAMLEKNGTLKKPGSVEPVEESVPAPQSTVGAPPPYQPPQGGGFTYSSPPGPPPAYATYPPPANAAYPPPPRY